MAGSSKIVDLRHLLAERFPQLPVTGRNQLATGIADIDQQIGGGLQKGAITELTSEHASAGTASLITALICAAYRNRSFIALIDGRDSFDPSATGPFGNQVLRYLLWIRCHDTREALKAADLLLRDGNFPLVVLDVVLNPIDELRKIPQTSWFRLQRLVEPTSTAFLVMIRQSMISSAQVKLVLENSWSLDDLDRPAQESLLKLQLRVRRSHEGVGSTKLQIARAG
jgi:hypothetical protein